MRKQWTMILALIASAGTAQAANFVAYGPSSDNEATYVTDAGHTVTSWDDSEWQAATAGDFAPFDAILVGDGECGDPTAPTGVWENAALWGPLTTGNIVMHGFDDHNSEDNDYDGLIVNCATFAAGGSGLGLCISIQCTNIPVAAPEGGPTFTIPGIGDFQLDGEDGDGIVIVNPDHPAMAGLTDDDLDCWGNSVHDHIQSFPEDFEVLAEDNGDDCGKSAAEGGEGDGQGVTGPVIIARGTVESILAIPTLSQVALALLAAVLGAASVLLLRRRRSA